MLDGGLSDLSDVSAPKVIKSNELSRFKLLTYNEELEIKRCYELVDKGENAFFRFSGENPGHEKLNDFECRVNRSALDELQAVIKKQGVSVYNGIHKKTNGATGEGYMLDVEYKSGERICSSCKCAIPDGWSDAKTEISEFFKKLAEDNGYSFAPCPLKTAIGKNGAVIASYLPPKSHRKMSIFLEVSFKDVLLSILVCDIMGITKGVYLSFEITAAEIKEGFSAADRTTGEPIEDMALVERAVVDGSYSIKLVFDGDENQSESYRI